MWNKITAFLREKRDVVSYLVFGVLTTLVNYAIYLPLYNFAHLSGGWSNAIAWVGAVIFAFFTNKPFVFQSHDWSAKVVLPEAAKFVGCRLGSGAAETGLVWLLVDILGGNGNIVKLAVSVFVVIVNYVASKLLVFRKK